jgi:ParB/RepB/Spo0J family partition protein
MPKDPVFLKIPTNRIRPNPNQPRRFITPSAIEQMEASLREIGQQTPAKVRAMIEAERLADPDHDYELIGGHIRHAGALKAGLATLDCLVLDLTPEQAELAGLVDNQTTDMHWLDWVIAIEKLNQGPAKLKQQAIADRLGVSQARVNNALKIAKALTPASRELIYQQLIKLGPDKAVTERSTLALASLGDPKKVEKALPVFLDRKMTAPQAQRLVKHLQEGNSLQDYNHQSTPKSSQPGKTGTSTGSQLGHIPLTTVPTQKPNLTLPELWEAVKAAWMNFGVGEPKSSLEEWVWGVRAIFSICILVWVICLVIKAVIWVIHLF